VTAKAHRKFWHFYNALPESVRRQADKQFVLWCENPTHPSLNFKKVGDDLWSNPPIRFPPLGSSTPIFSRVAPNEKKEQTCQRQNFRFIDVFRA
jgi:hypothetical protein